MINKRINTMYFSATNTTKKVVCGIAKKLSENFQIREKINNVDFTLPKVREKVVAFSKEDILVVGVPVYAGRVPNVLLKYLKTIIGNGALAVAVVVYGNRNYDDALIELKDILESDGFKVIGGAAFIGEHSFSNSLAKNRPDEKDMDVVRFFADEVYKKIIDEKQIKTVFVKGNIPYRKYYMPRDENENPIDIRKVKPKTNNNCINCKLCVNLCPMGSIDFEDVTKLNGICIKCCACIKKCPVKAKYFDDSGYLKHKQELEDNFKYRKEPELFI
ncbi:4Fe-4S dicluster domain protein [Clostridium sporogenes]|uniref:EFR1 family ferrodoxin n=1 Tax=Clostridium TaxID=1485 RepID=UPI00090A0381|nr:MULTISPECIES: EFR1 family ferrodoxin [Clostridium]APF28289.1 4Fe-4S dicluster domain protein [Clostridium sporogenes]MDI6918095.1 EFR1 family ferrodoxin [Clostridium botulinum]WMU96334.1 EFR1 family ferrodoxin [Clostridium botulinum]